MHPRNKNAAGYDLAALTATSAALAKYIKTTPAGTPSIDFANPAAVKILNRAILMHHYGVKGWDIPAGYLCPPIPGRADYIHSAADLLANAGYTQVYSITDGFEGDAGKDGPQAGQRIVNGWKNAGRSFSVQRTLE